VRGRPPTGNAPKIADRERPAAERAYEHAREVYRRILAETKTP
jgi:hypothetical protein